MHDDTSTFASIALGEIDLERIVGAGGQGEVWRGRSRSSGAPVAVKVLRSVARDAFWREAAALASLDHRHIVRVFDVTRVDEEAARASDGRLPVGAPCLVTRWLEAPGADRAGEWQVGEVASVALALLDALACAHARGLLHFDIKPDNVLIDADRLPVLIDFGLAAGRLEGGAPRWGTPGFMAPEVFRDGVGLIGPWSDLFGLGATLFVMLTGRLPFGGHDAPSRLLATLEAPQPSCPGPPGFAAWLARMLERDPGGRFGSAADAAAGLVEALERDGASLETTEVWLDALTLPSLTGLSFETGAGQGWQDAVHASARVATSSPSAEAKSGPMPGWRRANHGARSPMPVGVGTGLLALRELPFVGQEQARDALWRALGEVRSSGVGRVCRVEGGAGLGKTRLLGWLLERAEELGLATTLRVHGQHESEPLASLVDAIAASHTRYVRPSPDALATHLRALGLDDFEATVLTDLVDAAVPLAELEATLISKLVRTWLAGQARRAPLVVALDDADREPEVLGLLERLVDTDDLPLLVVAASGSPLRPRLGQRSGHGEPIALEPLDDGEASGALEASFGLSMSLTGTLLDAAGNHLGNAMTLLRAWLEEGALEPGRDGLRLRAAGQVTDLTAARLVGLPIEIAAVAAALGLAGRFSIARWRAISARVLDADEARFERAHDVLQRTGALLESAGGVQWLDRALLEAVVDEARRRQRLWVDIHDACLQDTESRVARGVHLIEAKRLDEAWRTAARWLDQHRDDAPVLQVFERNRLVALAELALDRAGVPDDDVRRGELMLYDGYAGTLRWMGTLERVEALLDACRTHGWDRLVPHALAQLGKALFPLGRLDEARDALHRAIELSGDDPTLRRTAQLDLAYTEELANRNDVAIELLEAALDDAAHHGHRKHQLRARCLLAGAYGEQPGRLEDALRLSLEIIETTDSMHTRSLGQEIAGSVSRSLGDIEASDGLFEANRALRQRRGLSTEMANIHLAINRLLRGDAEAARALCAPELERLEHKRYAHILAAAHFVMCACEIATGRRERAEHHLDRFDAEIGAVRSHDFAAPAARMRDQARDAGWDDLHQRCADLVRRHQVHPLPGAPDARR